MADLLDIEHRVHAAVAALLPRIQSLGPQILKLPEEQRAQAIGELSADERCRTFAELLIDLEEDPAARAVVAGVLRETERQRPC